MRAHGGNRKGARVEPTGGVGRLVFQPHAKVCDHIGGEGVLGHFQSHIKSAIELSIVVYVHQLDCSTLHTELIVRLVPCGACRTKYLLSTTGGQVAASTPRIGSADYNAAGLRGLAPGCRDTETFCTPHCEGEAAILPARLRI